MLTQSAKTPKLRNKKRNFTLGQSYATRNQTRASGINQNLDSLRPLIESGGPSSPQATAQSSAAAATADIAATAASTARHPVFAFTNVYRTPRAWLWT